MTTNYLPNILGGVMLLCGIYGSLVAFGLFDPKYHSDKKKIRFRTPLMKVCCIFLIFIGVRDTFKEREKSNIEWTKEDRELLIKNCKEGSKSTGIKYPQITKDYCECAMDKLMKSISKENYKDYLAKPQDQWDKEVKPLYQDCINELNQRIDNSTRPAK